MKRAFLRKGMDATNKKKKKKSQERENGDLHSWVPRRALSPVTQMVASSADGAIRSREAKSSPWMMEKMQSRAELLEPTAAQVAADDEAEVDDDEDDDDDDWLADEAATTAAAAAAAPDEVPDDDPCPTSTSEVCTLRTSRMLEIKTKIEKKNICMTPANLATRGYTSSVIRYRDRPLYFLSLSPSLFIRY